MLGSRKLLAIGFYSLVSVVIAGDVGGSAGKWYRQPIWRKPEGNKPLELSSRPSSEGRAEKESPRDGADSLGRFARNRRTEGRFVFPDAAVDARLRQPVPACEGSTFCEDVPRYPTDLVNNIVKYDRSLKQFENVDAMDAIAHRMGVISTESLCLSRERLIRPRSAESMDKQWLFIVNHPNFTQGVRVEECVDNGNSCRMIEGFAEGYTTSCEQKYVYRELTAITSDGTVGRDYFKFPASCCCNVRFTGMESRARLFDDILPQSSIDQS